MATGALTIQKSEAETEMGGRLDRLIEQQRGADSAYRTALDQEAAVYGQPVSDRNAWLRMAAGFMGPTKSGHWMEGIGNGLKEFAGEDSKVQEQKRGQLAKIAQIRQAQARLQGASAKEQYDLEMMRYGLPQKAYEAEQARSNLSTLAATNGTNIPFQPAQPPAQAPAQAPAPVPARPTINTPIPGSVPTFNQGGMVDDDLEAWGQSYGISAAAPAPAEAPSLFSPEPMAPSRMRVGSPQAAPAAPAATPAPQAPAAAPAARQDVYTPDMVDWAGKVVRDSITRGRAYEVNPSLKGDLARAQAIIAGSRQEESAAAAQQRMDLMKQASEARIAAAEAKAAQGAKDPYQEALAKKEADQILEARAAAKTAGEAREAMKNTAAAYDQVMWPGRVGGVASHAVDILTNGKYGRTGPIQSVTPEAWVKMVEPIKGALSNQEGLRFDKALITEYTDPETRKFVATAHEAASQRAMARADFIEVYRQRHGTLAGADHQWSAYVNENPITLRSKEGELSLNPHATKPELWMKYASQAPLGLGRPQAAPAGAPATGGARPVRTLRFDSNGDPVQ